MIDNTTTSSTSLPKVAGDGQALVASLLAQAQVSHIAGLVIAVLIVQALYSTYLHPLRKVPGPTLAKFSTLWRGIRYFRGSWHDDCVAMHKKYGPVVRIAPNAVSFVDAGALKALYGHCKPLLKGHWYEVWNLPNMTISFFATQDVKLHRHLRSRVSGAYSMSSILAMEPLIQEVAELNWKRFRDFANQGTVIDLRYWVDYFAFDVVGSLALGGKLGFLEQGKDISLIIESIHNGFFIMTNMGYFPGQMWIFNNRVSKYFVRKYGGRRLNAFDDFLRWLENVVDKRMKDGLGEGRRDMLQHFIESKDESGQPVKKGDVMSEGVNILGAGADTTACAIRAVLGDLLIHPVERKRLQVEIDQAYESLGGRHLTYKEAEKLPFLSAVIKESMRMHPSIQFQLPRHVPKEGVQLREHFLPWGTECGMSPRSMNRCQAIFGEDSDTWRPERWLATGPEDEARVSSMTTQLATFGVGSRACVGRNIALVEVHKYVSQFTRQFELDPVNKEQPWKTWTSWFSVQTEFNVRIKERHFQQK